MRRETRRGRTMVSRASCRMRKMRMMPVMPAIMFMFVPPRVIWCCRFSFLLCWLRTGDLRSAESFYLCRLANLRRSRDMGSRHNGCVRFCCAVAIWAADTMDVSGFVAQSRYGQPTQWMCQFLLRSCDMGNRHNGCVRFCCAVAIWATDTMDVSGFVAQLRYGQPTQWMCQVLLRSHDMGSRHRECVRACRSVAIWAADTENVSGLVALLWLLYNDVTFKCNEVCFWGIPFASLRDYVTFKYG